MHRASPLQHSIIIGNASPRYCAVVSSSLSLLARISFDKEPRVRARALRNAFPFISLSPLCGPENKRKTTPRESNCSFSRAAALFHSSLLSASTSSCVCVCVTCLISLFSSLFLSPSIHYSLDYSRRALHSLINPHITPLWILLLPPRARAHFSRSLFLRLPSLASFSLSLRPSGCCSCARIYRECLPSLSSHSSAGRAEVTWRVRRCDVCTYLCIPIHKPLCVGSTFTPYERGVHERHVNQPREQQRRQQRGWINRFVRDAFRHSFCRGLICGWLYSPPMPYRVEDS